MARRLAVVLFLLVVLVPSAVHAAAGPRFHIMPRASLADDGAGVTVGMMITCPAGGDILEAFFYVTQDETQSQFAGVSVPCDGRPHKVVGTAWAFEGTPFHAGTARVSGYLLVTDEDGNTESVSPGRTVRILG